MLLTKDEQEKIKSYIEFSLIQNQQSIRILFKEVEEFEDEQAFIEYMINKNYESAFELCIRKFNVHNNLQFTQYLLDMFYPNVKRDWAKYFILVQTQTFDDFELFDKCLTNECKAFDAIYEAIYL